MSNNKGWVLEDGKLYNNSLTNNVIKPGEKRELTLVLTKKMTTDNLGVVTNGAEIIEAENIRGLKEYDSMPGNKLETEDDYSKVDLLLGIKTGRILLYTSLSFTVLIILAVGVFEIKKVVKAVKIIK